MIDALLTFIDWILHLNQHLYVFVQHYGDWIYVLLFAIVFCETGLVITPFLPGDSLLFAAGSIAAITDLNPHIIVASLITAACLGDNTNYWIGRFVGRRMLDNPPPFFKRSYYDKTHAFYERYGGGAIIFARFVPIVRTFMPFTAGVAAMTYKRFMGMSVLAAFIWVGILVYSSYYFGHLPIVKDNFAVIVLGIIGISITPPIIALIKYWVRSKSQDI